MRNTIALAISAILSGAAYAQPDMPCNGACLDGPVSIDQRTVTNDNRVNNNPASSSRSNSDSSAQSDSNSSATGGAGGTGGSVSYTESDSVRYSGGYDVKSVPSMGLATPGATAPCYVSHGISGSGVGFGFGINSHTYDLECEVRETVRLGLVSGDLMTWHLSNVVLQERLMGYLSESKGSIETRRQGFGRDRTTGMPAPTGI